MCTENGKQQKEMGVEDLRRELDEIKSLLRDNTMQCQRMGNHIDFVENVYAMVRAPLQWFVLMWQRMPSSVFLPTKHHTQQSLGFLPPSKDTNKSEQ